MALPTHLLTALDQAAEALQKHPKFDLNLGYRRLVWSQLGPRDGGGVKVGHLRRVSLATRSIRKVMDSWNKALPMDDGPLRAIALSEDVANGKASSSTALSTREELWLHCDELANEREDLQIVLGVGYGAAQALAVAVEDEEFDGQQDVALTDSEVDPEDLDCSFFAAATYANGPVWDDGSDSLKRKEFWEWWLHDAVPSVYASIAS